MVEVPFYSIRNASCPEDIDNGRKVLFGHMPARAILRFGTEENVRDYLVGVPGKDRRVYKQVHRAIRDTLETRPHEFSVLNGGVVIVARDYEIDEKKKVLKLLQPNIINGSQTRGVLQDYYRDMERRGQEPPNIHVTFELIATEDDDLIANTSIARNFQEDVMAISIVGRLGQLDELELALQRVYPNYKLRQSETQISDDYVVTEKLIQVITALTPAELWPKAGEEGNPMVKEIPDGIIFPILAALSAFAEETPNGWKIVPPDTFSDEELISAAATVYQEIADSNPQSMGKSKACYSQLLQITALYKRLSSRA